MKIDKLLKDLTGLGTIDIKILNYLKEHPDEVFTYYDDAFANAFPDVNRNSIDWVLWNLARKGKIGKVKIGRRVYFGSHEAIKHLNENLGTDET